MLASYSFLLVSLTLAKEPALKLFCKLSATSLRTSMGRSVRLVYQGRYWCGINCCKILQLCRGTHRSLSGRHCFLLTIRDSGGVME